MLKMENVSKIYRTNLIETHALRKVDLHIGAGEFVSVTGPSGSGKTTFLNLAGLLETFEEGDFYLDGQNVKGLKRFTEDGDIDWDSLEQTGVVDPLGAFRGCSPPKATKAKAPPILPGSGAQARGALPPPPAPPPPVPRVQPSRDQRGGTARDGSG